MNNSVGGISWTALFFKVMYIVFLKHNAMTHLIDYTTVGTSLLYTGEREKFTITAGDFNTSPDKLSTK